MAKRAEARYVISADDQTKTGINSATRGFQNLERSVFSFGAAAVTAGNLASRAIGGIAESAMDAIKAIPRLAQELDDLGKQAKDVGTSADEFLAIAHATDLAGLSTEKTTKMLEKMQDAIAEARTGNKEYADSFAQIGVNVDDLAGAGVAEKLLRVIGGLQATFNQGRGDEATQARRSILGRNLGRLQQQGAGAFVGGLADFAQLSGGGIGRAIPAGERAVDEAARMKVAARALKVEVGDPFVNAWADLLKATTDQLVGLRRFLQEGAASGLIVNDRTPQNQIPEFRGDNTGAKLAR